MKEFVIIVCVIILFNVVIGVLIESKRKKDKKLKEDIDAGEAPVVQNTKTRHVAGLPVPDGAPCFVQVYTDRVVFLSASKRFVIPLSRITEATMYTDTEMRQQIHSSLFHTMLGGAAFGDAGAVIGAMPHSKYKKVISKYNLIVSFKAKDESDSAVVVSCNESLKSIVKAIHLDRNDPSDDQVVEL